MGMALPFAVAHGCRHVPSSDGELIMVRSNRNDKLKPQFTGMLIVIGLLVLSPNLVQAQSSTVMEIHSNPRHSMQPKVAPDNSTNSKPPMKAMEHRDATRSTPDSGETMRDPNAYSGGYTLDSGPFLLPPSDRLRLADEHRFSTVLLDRFERVWGPDENSTAIEGQFRYGTDYDRLILKSELDIARGKLQDGRTEALWGHAIAPYWDSLLGIAYDGGVGPDRGWAAIGVQGLAPYWFEVNATAYLGSGGRVALDMDASYELLLTQKLILQPSLEMSIYGKSDEARGIGSGLNNGAVGLRLRYELTRQLAPYIGVEYARTFGSTADIARNDGERVEETRLVAGVRIWF